MSGGNYSYLHDHFGKINHILLQENEQILNRVTYTNLIIGQYREMVRILIEKSHSSFEAMKKVVEQMSFILKHYHPNHEVFNYAKTEVQNQILLWNGLENQINSKLIQISAKRPKRQKTHRLRQTRRHYNDNLSTYNNRELVNIVPIQTFPDTSSNINDLPLPTEKSKPIKNLRQSNASVKIQHIENGTMNFYVNESQNYKMKLREEFYSIKQFVQNVLVPMVEYAENQSSNIPKKIILNIYMNYNRQKRRVVQIDQTGKIQMELTNQLKNNFPKIEMTRKCFKGIRFRGQYAEQMNLTDRSPPIRQQDITFDEEDYFDPIDQILRQAEQKTTIKSLAQSGQVKVKSLDKMLGL